MDGALSAKQLANGSWQLALASPKATSITAKDAEGAKEPIKDTKKHKGNETKPSSFLVSGGAWFVFNYGNLIDRLLFQALITICRVMILFQPVSMPHVQ